jgi:hypothetical protein
MLCVAFCRRRRGGVSAAAAAGVVWSGRSASKSFFTIPIYYFLKSSVTSQSRARVKKNKVQAVIKQA